MLGNHALRYLYGSKHRGLMFSKAEADELESLQVFADTSYDPPHEKYRRVQGLALMHGPNVLMWASTRQPFIGQSTAESELLGYAEGLQCGESTASLLSVFGYQVRRKLIGDCKSALSQLTVDTGSWRTRHLRIRSAELRECVQSGDGTWSAEHCAGERLVADGLTKLLQGAAFDRFVMLLGMV